MLWRDPPDSVLIEAPHVRGRNATRDRADRQFAPTEAHAPTMPPLPLIEWQDAPIPKPEPAPSWPLMTRVRLWLAAKLIGL